MRPYFKELLAIFNANQVEYLVIGAHALAFYCEPRFTKDHDVWVNPSPENAPKVFDSLAEFGAALSGLAWRDFTVPGNVFQLGVTSERIDVLTSPDGVIFEDCWSRRVDFDHEGTFVHFLGKSDLIANKRAAGRAQDLLDIEMLEKQDGPKE